MEELISRVLASEKTKSVWKNDYKSQEWREANQLNRDLFGQALNQSPNCECLDDLFEVLKHRATKKRIMTKSTKRFKLVSGQTIMVHGCQPITEHSSDEECIKLLKLHKGHIVSFASYPENWEDIVAGKEKFESVEDAEEEVEENETAEEVEEEEEEEKESTRREELSTLTNQQLKDMIPEHRMPKKTTKAHLVDAIIEIDSEG